MRWVNRLLTITMIPVDNFGTVVGENPGRADALESRQLPFKPVGEKVDSFFGENFQLLTYRQKWLN